MSRPRTFRCPDCGAVAASVDVLVLHAQWCSEADHAPGCDCSLACELRGMRRRTNARRWRAAAKTQRAA